MTYDFQTSKEFCGSQNSEISRRSLFQLMEYSVTGIAGISILEAGGGPNPPHTVDVTVTPFGTVATNNEQREKSPLTFWDTTMCPFIVPLWIIQMQSMLQFNSILER